MRILSKGEGYTRSYTVQDNSVRIQHSTLNKPSGKNYVLTTTFNFEGVSQVTILRWAAEALLIRWRTAFKNAKEVKESDDNMVVQVTKMLTKRKPAKSAVEKVRDLGGKMSKDALRKAIAELEALAEEEELEELAEEELDEEESGDEETEE